MRASTLAILGALLFIFRGPLRIALTSMLETAKTATDPIRRAIEREEGRRNYAYKDDAGKWTFGVGHLILPHESHLLSYTKENPAPDSVVDELLDRDLATAKGEVRQLVQVPLTPGQTAALVSFAFQFGYGALRNSTLLRKLNAKDYKGAADELLKWTKAVNPQTGVKETVPGIVARRQRERELFLTA